MKHRLILFFSISLQLLQAGTPSLVEGRRDSNIVVTDHSFSSQAALKTLEEGGSAMDAAISALLTLNCVEPALGGIGGGIFLLYYDRKSETIYSYDGRETAPQLMKSTSFLTHSGKPYPFEKIVNSGLAVGVPGTLKTIALAHEKHGKKKWADLFAYAIDLADNGFFLSQNTSEKLQLETNRFESSEAVKRVFYNFDQKRWKITGEKTKNPLLAQTFRILASQGIQPFYEGSLAKEIVSKSRSCCHDISKLPVILSLNDLKDYEVKVRTPLKMTHKDYEIYGLPPPSSSASVFQFLALATQLNMSEQNLTPIEKINLTIEALKSVAYDRARFFADIDFTSPQIHNLLSQSYTNATAKKILNHEEIIKNEDLAGVIFGEEEGGNNTTHISIIDREGNAVSLTTSLEKAFGSGIFVQGFFLNSELTDFSKQPTRKGILSANRIQGGKRPLSSQSPLLAINKNTKDVALVLGGSGGEHIFPSLALCLDRLLNQNLTAEESMKESHITLHQGAVVLEEGSPLGKYKHDLQKLGHEVIIKEIPTGINLIDARSKTSIKGVSDTRQYGKAMIFPIPRKQLQPSS